MWTVVRLLFATTTVRLCSASRGPLRPASCRHPVSFSLLSCRRTISDGPPVMGHRGRAERDKSESRAETAARDSQRRTEPVADRSREKRERQRRKSRAARPGHRQKEGNEGGRHKVSSSKSPRRKRREEERNEKLSSVVRLANSPSHPLSSPRQNERKRPISALAKRSQGGKLQKEDQNQGKTSHRDPRTRRRSSGSSSAEMTDGVSRRLPAAGKETSCDDVQVLAVIDGAEKGAAERQESPSADVQLLAAIERAGKKAQKGGDQQIADRGAQQPNQQNVFAASQQNMSLSQQNVSLASQHVLACQQKVSSANQRSNSPQRTSTIQG